MQNRNNFHATNFAAYIIIFLINNRIAWLVPKKDLSEMLQEQADWYQGKTDPYETTVSFCIINSEHWQTSEMEIFPKINSGYFYKRLHLRFARVPRSVSAELRSHNVALAFTTNRPARKIRHCGRSKRFSERCSVYKSNLTDTRYGELKEILNVILNIVHKTHIVLSFLMSMS